MTGLPLPSSAASPRLPDARPSTPYGAAELRRTANRTLMRGFVLASALALTGFGGARWAAAAFATPSAVPSSGITVDWLPPPPTPEPAATSGRPASRPSASPATAAVPVPVPDTAAPSEPETVSFAPPADPALPSGDGQAGEALGNGVGTTGDGAAPVDLVPAEPPAVPADPPVPPAPTTPEPDPTVFLRVEVMPTVASRVQPEYPEMARAAGIEGRVTVRVRVGRDGRVKDALVVRTDNRVFDDAALDAVRRWTFTPGVQAGSPVEVWMTIPIRFRQAAR